MKGKLRVRPKREKERRVRGEDEYRAWRGREKKRCAL